jgi:hypothetical protein
LEHQRRWGEAIAEGFRAHGHAARIDTSKNNAGGDVHVVYGPHYAFNEWVGKPNVLYANRCFYGSKKEWMSLGWLNVDGSRDFMNRGKPKGRWNQHRRKLQMELEPMASGRIATVFGDYVENRPRYLEIMRECSSFGWAVKYRKHPDAPDWEFCPYERADGHLVDVLTDCRVAIGFATSALVTAALRGVPVVCFDPSNPVHEIASHRLNVYGMTSRRAWVYRLAWTQWHIEELRGGEFWNHLGKNYADQSSFGTVDHIPVGK